MAHAGDRRIPRRTNWRAAILGAAVDERQWWTFESDFDVAHFDAYEFNERYGGPVVATVGQTSFTWQVALQPKSGRYYNKAGGIVEVRDWMGIVIKLVDGPIDTLEGVKYSTKVYKADGSLGLTCGHKSGTLKMDKWHVADCLPFAGSSLPINGEQLRPYLLLLGRAGVEYVRVRVELGIPKAAFDPLHHVPLPAPRFNLAERLAQWYRSGVGTVKLVASDGTQFTVYKDLLTDSSEALAWLHARGARRIRMGDLCGEALDELISHITFGSTRPTRVCRHVLELLNASQLYELPDLKVVCERAVIEKILAQKVPADFLDVLKAAEKYELRVASNTGLCRLLKAFHQLPDADRQRFDSDEFTDIRCAYMELASQSQLARNL